MLLAACAGISGSEFRSFLKQVKDSDIVEVLDNYEALKLALREMREPLFSQRLQQATMELDTTSNVKKDVLYLISTSKLSRDYAARLISDSLIEYDRALNDKLPEYIPKLGLHRWIDRVLRLVGPNVLLNAATKALSSYPESAKERWGLSRP
jgi:hypothetical protein